MSSLYRLTNRAYREYDDHLSTCDTCAEQRHSQYSRRRKYDEHRRILKMKGQHDKAKELGGFKSEEWRCDASLKLYIHYRKLLDRLDMACRAAVKRVEFQYPSSPEARLMHAIVAQAAADIAASREEFRSPEDKRSALRYLNNPKHAWLCGVEPIWVRATFLKLLCFDQSDIDRATKGG